MQVPKPETKTFRERVLPSPASFLPLLLLYPSLLLVFLPINAGLGHLLGRLHPGGIVLAAVLFGGLEAGAGAMQRDAGVPAVAVQVVQAVVIVTMVVAGKKR